MSSAKNKSKRGKADNNKNYVKEKSARQRKLSPHTKKLEGAYNLLISINHEPLVKILRSTIKNLLFCSLNICASANRTFLSLRFISCNLFLFAV